MIQCEAMQAAAILPVILALVVGAIFALALAALIRSMLLQAHGHGNKVLPFLHIAWIITIVGFATQVPTLFG